jgi:septal ring factor EnvC (AmiA/AmiB activator)
MRFFINQTISSHAVKAALGQALEKKAKADESRRELQQFERKLNEIVKDQERLRANIKELPQGSAAHSKYLKKFDDQEGEIETLRAQIKKHQDEEFANRKAFEDFLAKLDIE